MRYLKEKKLIGVGLPINRLIVKLKMKVGYCISIYGSGSPKF